MPCDVEHLGHAFAARFGRREYGRLMRDVPPGTLATDWVFAEALFGAAIPAPRAYVADVLAGDWRLSGELVELVLRARGLVAGFLRRALADIDWSRYAVLGFSASVGQTVASLAMAKAVKKAHPAAHVVFGGPAWHGVMGRRQLAEFLFVDAACGGDGDSVFPAYCLWLAKGGRGPRPAGLLFRSSGGAGVRPPSPPSVTGLDALPTPDYTDFYRALALWGGDARVVQLAAEASRGCWWAARLPCAFCGLNGSSRSYRSKSADRILTELRELDRRWQPWLIDLVDNVVPPAFLREVLPRLAASPLAARLFIEARPELTRPQLRLAARAGTHVQLGIESLNQHVLDLLGKGTDARGNVRQLRWCRDEGVPVTWNLLHGIPGETARDYREMRSLLPLLRQLPAPEGCGALEVHRFSRYFSQPAAFGIVNVRPAAAYRYVYPFRGAKLHDLAYLFDHELAQPVGEGAQLERELSAFLLEAHEWMASAAAPRQAAPSV